MDRWSYVTGPADQSRPLPLVIDLHGFSEGADIHRTLTQLTAYGELHGFMVATPQGTAHLPFWNAPNVASGPHDEKFFLALIDDIGRHHCLDRGRVFFTGLSNGAFMSSRMACDHADRITAIAAVAGLMYPKDCHPSRPIPVMGIHGTADRFVRFDGGYGDKGAALPRDPVASPILGMLSFDPVPTVAQRWATHNHCPSPTNTAIAADVELRTWTCPHHADVALYIVMNGGHTWPGSVGSAAVESVIGHTTMSFDANEQIWKFFRAAPSISVRDAR